MKKSKSSNKFGLDKFNEMNEMNEKYEINTDEIINLKNVSKILLNDNECPNCKKNSYIEIKKFTSLDEQLDLEKLDNDFGRCTCGKRHIDIVMAQILKIMKEENIEFRRFILRNGPIPLLTPMYNNKNEPYIKKKSLIILHPELTKKIAKKIMEEVSEVKGVIKGDPNDTVGLIDVDSKSICYELLEGSDIRCDIVESPAGEIIVNKIQHLSYLEFPPSMENKIRKLWEYLKSKQLSKEKIANLTVLDGTCGNGTLGIFLLKLGAKKVVFNDIWKPATIMTLSNLKANGFGEKSKDKEIECIDKRNCSASKGQIAYGNKFEVYNLSLEDLKKLLNKKIGEIEENKFDICILDCFPEANPENFEKIAKSLAKDVFII